MGRGCRLLRSRHRDRRDERLAAVEARLEDRIARRPRRGNGARGGGRKLARGNGGPPRALRRAEGNARRGARPNSGGRAIRRHSGEPVGAGPPRRHEADGRDKSDSATDETATAHRRSLRHESPGPHPSHRSPTATEAASKPGGRHGRPDRQGDGPRARRRFPRLPGNRVVRERGSRGTAHAVESPSRRAREPIESP